MLRFERNTRIAAEWRYFVLVLLAAFTLSFFLVGVASAAEVNLAWDANTEPDLAGYRIYKGEASGSYSGFIEVGKVTTCTVTGLVEGHTYYFAATALDAQGNESGYSNEVSYSVKDTMPPTNPHGLRLGLNK